MNDDYLPPPEVAEEIAAMDRETAKWADWYADLLSDKSRLKGATLLTYRAKACGCELARVVNGPDGRLVGHPWRRHAPRYYNGEDGVTRIGQPKAWPLDRLGAAGMNCNHYQGRRTHAEIIGDLQSHRPGTVVVIDT